jgi:CRISPR-associated endonuclease Csn1
VALTDRSRVQKLSRLYKTGESGAELEPWDHFRDAVVAALESINVSHRVQRKVGGALHKETIYGPVRKKSVRGELVETPGEFVVRKPVESLTMAMVEDIRDPIIKKLVVGRIAEFEAKMGKSFRAAIPKDVWAQPLLMDSGVPIKKVRFIKRDETIRPIRDNAFVKPGSTHHLCIFEWTEKGKKRREAVFVSMLEAIDRVKNRQPIISRNHPKRPEAKFVMSLSRGELVLAPKGGNQPMVYNTAASTQGQIYFHLHTDARAAAERQKFVVTANSMSRDARKVTVDPIGRIRWAND